MCRFNIDDDDNMIDIILGLTVRSGVVVTRSVTVIVNVTGSASGTGTRTGRGRGVTRTGSVTVTRTATASVTGSTAGIIVSSTFLF